MKCITRVLNYVKWDITWTVPNIGILEHVIGSAVLEQSGSGILLEHHDRDQFRTKIPEQILKKVWNSSGMLNETWDFNDI